MKSKSVESRVRAELEYPFGDRWCPDPGVPFEVADGVFWLRMPLPIALDHINLWILRDGDGWTLVDSGYDSDICRDVWAKVFAEFIRPHEVKRIIVTHYHPDHIGLAAWLAAKCDCRILMTHGEFELYHSIHTRDPQHTEIQVAEYVRELGYDASANQRILPFFLSEEKPRHARVQREQCDTIEDNSEVTIGTHVWRVVTGNGHSPEHACLYCADLDVLISGDQAIPRISSNVSVYPSNRQADPLGDWLESCKKLQTEIPDTAMILPSHQEPFYQLHKRMQQLIDDHESQLNQLRLAVQAPISAIQARGVLFDRDLNSVETLLATGETLAHLNYLRHRDEIVMRINNGGVAVYSDNA